MGTRVLIDSNIVIDVLAGVPQALLEMRAHRDRAISVVTWIEIMAGFDSSTQAERDFFSQEFPIINLTAEIAEETALLRKTTRLKLPDAVILATAHIEKRVLLTRNTRDFAPGRFVRVPYTL